MIPLKILLILDAGPAFSWQAHLAARLRASGHEIAVETVRGDATWPRAVQLVLDLESLVYRRRGPKLSARSAMPADLAGPACDRTPDIVLDLSSRAGPGGRDLRLLYDGSPDPAAAVAALLDGVPPRLDLVGDGRPIESGWPANENPASLAAGLEAVFARAIDLCCRAVARRAAGPQDESLAPAPLAAAGIRSAGREAIRFALATLVAKARARLLRRLAAPPAWRVGVRSLVGPGIRETGIVPERGFAWLPQDAGRYFADPFLIRHDGRVWMFCEEVPHRTGTGLISVSEIGPDGRPGPAQPVLETGSHLSYPYVFAQGGAVWMIPESSAAGDVALYRATDFPWRWIRERTLLDGLHASDTTPFEAEGRLWLFATLTGAAGGSSWDALGLFHARDLFGTFAPHPLNPVLVDAGAARPAGRIVWQGGHAMRVAQDCRAGYGAGIALARIVRLDEDGYRQTVTGQVAAPPAWNAAGLHTIDRVEGWEAIDCLSAVEPG